MVPEQKSQIQKTRETVSQVPVASDEPGLWGHDEKYLPNLIPALRGLPHPSLNEHYVQISTDELGLLPRRPVLEHAGNVHQQYGHDAATGSTVSHDNRLQLGKLKIQNLLFIIRKIRRDFKFPVLNCKVKQIKLCVLVRSLKLNKI